MNNKRRKRIIIIVILFAFAGAFCVCSKLYHDVKEILYATTYRHPQASYLEDFYANKNVMLIVPHEDDEYNVAGGVLEQYVDAGSTVRVVYTTNGDAYGGGEKRINESIAAMVTLGIPEENLIFLGYGDSWETEYKHLYYAPGDEVITSELLETKTYGTPMHPDYRTMISGTPSSYTRNNYKKDMKDVILQYHPDVILGVDDDEHPDHKATSLFFEEVMGEILKEESDYHPKVYKGFGYCTAWDSVDDYYQSNILETKNPSDSDYMEKRNEYNWSDRVRFPMNTEVLAYSKRSSRAYAVFSAYVSQDALINFKKVVNSDKVFWERDTNSILYHAKIEVTSGDSDVLNDFKLSDSSEMYHGDVVWNRGIWIPSESDQEKAIKVTFETPQEINRVVLYDNVSLEDNITSGTLVFSDQSTVKVGSLSVNGAPTEIQFENKKNITGFEFKIDSMQGANAGIMEIEAYKDQNNRNELQYLKVTSDDNFVYDYFIPSQSDISLSVYTYPKQLDVQKYDIFEDENKIKTVELLPNESFTIPYNGKNHVIKVVSSESQNIYDEVYLKPYSFYKRFIIELCQKVEEIRDQKQENK